MKLTSAIAIYFITWWLCLFLTLPFGVKNAHEEGVSVADGHDAGAPVKPMLWRKVAFTTVLATIVFILVYGEVTRGWISFDSLSWLSQFGAG
jgi:predicted secreted protein